MYTIFSAKICIEVNLYTEKQPTQLKYYNEKLSKIESVSFLILTCNAFHASAEKMQTEKQQKYLTIKPSFRFEMTFPPG